MKKVFFGFLFFFCFCILYLIHNNKQNVLQRSKYFIEKEGSEISRKETEELGEIILYHSNLYYNEEAPIISDGEYDVLFVKLTEREEFYDFESRISLSVGSTATESSFKKVKHSRAMTSLDNTHNEEDLSNFNERVEKLVSMDASKIEYMMEFKFDGLGVELIYKK